MPSKAPKSTRPKPDSRSKSKPNPKPKPNSTSSLPKNWPPSLTYLTKPIYSPTLKPHHLNLLRTPSAPSPSPSLPDPSQHPPSTITTSKTPSSPNPLIKIRAIENPSHPAFGQSGLFAAKDLPPGSFILEYLGVVHASIPSSSSSPVSASADSDPHAHSDYDLSLLRTTTSLPIPQPASSSSSSTSTSTYASIPNPTETSPSPEVQISIGIDASCSGNEARFINDYRGILARPNAEFRELWIADRGSGNGGGGGGGGSGDSVGRGGERGMGVFVLGAGRRKRDGERERGVRKGEELCVSYGRGWWGARRGEEVEENELVVEMERDGFGSLDGKK